MINEREETGLKTRMRAHARAQANAGSGYLGAITRAANNAREFGLNQLSIAGNALGFKMEQRLSSSQRNIATASGLGINNALDKNKTEPFGSPNTLSARANPALTAALLKGPNSMAQASKSTEQTRFERAYGQARSGEGSWSNTASGAIDSVYSGAARAANASLPESLSQYVTQASEERQMSKQIAGDISGVMREHMDQNKGAVAAEDKAANARMAATGAQAAGGAATAALGLTGVGAVAAAAGASTIAAGAQLRAASQSEIASQEYEKTIDKSASGRDMFLSNTSQELSEGNAAQSSIDRTNAGKSLLGAADTAVGGEGVFSSILGAGADYVRGTSSQQEKVSSSHAEAARNLQHAARGAKNKNSTLPENASSDASTNLNTLSKNSVENRPQVGKLKKNVANNYLLSSALARGPSEAVVRSQRQSNMNSDRKNGES